MSVIEEIPQRAGFFRRVLGAFRTLILGTFFCVWAPTSLIVLGWLMRRMRHVALTRAGLSSERPSWIMGRSHRWYARLLGGFAANMREGIMAAFSLALATAPFTVIWLLSWWAGWENSFSKGYEQAFVGPMLGLAGVAVFCVLMIWIPMALADQAVENRALALFEWRMVRSAVRHSGWGYVFLAVVTVVMSLPLFAGRGLVTFASGIIPGFDEMSPAEALEIMGRIDLALAAYVFLGLVILRGWAHGFTETQWPAPWRGRTPSFGMALPWQRGVAVGGGRGN